MTTYLSRLPCWLWVVDDIIHGCDVGEGQFVGARTKSEAVDSGAPRSEAGGKRRAKVTEETWEQSAREAESEEQINSWPSWCWTWWEREREEEVEQESVNREILANCLLTSNLALKKTLGFSIEPEHHEEVEGQATRFSHAVWRQFAIQSAFIIFYL